MERSVIISYKSHQVSHQVSQVIRRTFSLREERSRERYFLHTRCSQIHNTCVQSNKMRETTFVYVLLCINCDFRTIILCVVDYMWGVDTF